MVVRAAGAAAMWEQPWWVMCVMELLSWLHLGAVCKPLAAPTTRLPDMVLQLNIRNATATFIAYKYRPGIFSGRDRSGEDAAAAGERAINGSMAGEDGGYDGEGAMYFAVAVILLYGVSIALLVGTTLHRHDYEYEVKGFLRSYARIDQQKRTREKQRMRRTLIEKNMLSMLPGCTLTATPTLLGLPQGGATFSTRSSDMTSLAEVEEEPEVAQATGTRDGGVPGSEGAGLVAMATEGGRWTQDCSPDRTSQEGTGNGVEDSSTL